MIDGCTTASASTSNELVDTSGSTSEIHSQTTCTARTRVRNHQQRPARPRGPKGRTHVKPVDELLPPELCGEVVVLLEPGRHLLFPRQAAAHRPNPLYLPGVGGQADDRAEAR